MLAFLLLHFTDEETEAERNEFTCPKSGAREGQNWAINLGLFNLKPIVPLAHVIEVIVLLFISCVVNIYENGR